MSVQRGASLIDALVEEKAHNVHNIVSRQALEQSLKRDSL